jgi:small conductance mechanosensitive channel
MDFNMFLKFTPMVVFSVILTLSAAVIPLSTHANQGSSPESTSNVQNIAYEQLLEEIKSQKLAIKKLDKRIAESSGITQKALQSRLIKEWINLLELNLGFAKRVAEAEKSGTKIDEQRILAIEILGSQVSTAQTTAAIINEQIVLPDTELSAAEQAAAYSRVFKLLDTLNHVYVVFIDSLEVSRQFEMDVVELETRLKENLLERAATGSALLELAMDDVIALSASAKVVPGDAEVKARLNVTINHVSRLAHGLTEILAMMDSVGMDTTAYQNQLLNATGQITTDVFEVGVFTDLLIGWGGTLWSALIESGPGLVFKLILFFIIVFVFFKLAGLVQKLTETALENSHIELSQLLRRMVVSIARNTVVVVGVLIALSQVGISLGPLLAGLGVVGFVVGFALQDTLSNFAAGLLILIYRPFDVEDIIDAGGVTGTVSHMSLVNTTILTFDNQTIVVPNNKIWGDVIKNVTAQTIRRVDMVFGIAYSDDIVKAENVLQEIVSSHKSVLNEPETMIRLHELGESSVNFIVRPWVNKDDYWETYWDITRTVKLRFDDEGISIPFPQTDVHIHKP